MTRSIFDPTGGETERSGSTFTPPDANQGSHLPAEFDNPQASSAAGTVPFEPPLPVPPVQISSEQGGKLMVVQLSGKLSRPDYRQLLGALTSAISSSGKIKVLALLHHFHGIEPGAIWDDLKFDVSHFNDIERLAIVGDRRWEQWIAMGRPFTTAEIQFFPIEQEQEARAWAAAGS